MTFQEIQDLIKLISKSKLTEFKMKNGDFELSVRTKDYQKKQITEVIQSQPQVMQIPTAMPQMATPAAPATPAPTPAPATAAPAQNTAASEAEDTTNYIEVRSPIVGTFYRSGSPEKPPCIKVGDSVAVGDTVCIVEAMKLFNEIESEVAGKVYKVMVEDASPVGYDQVLFLLEPA